MPSDWWHLQEPWFFEEPGPGNITQWMKLVGAGSRKCHGSNIHGNTPPYQCAKSVLVSFMSVSLLMVYHTMYIEPVTFSGAGTH